MTLPPHHLLLHENPEWLCLSSSGLPRLSLKKRLLNGCIVVPTAATPASEGEAVVRSPTNMAAAKIAAVDFIDLY